MWQLMHYQYRLIQTPHQQIDNVTSNDEAENHLSRQEQTAIQRRNDKQIQDLRLLQASLPAVCLLVSEWHVHAIMNHAIVGLHDTELRSGRMRARAEHKGVRVPRVNLKDTDDVINEVITFKDRDGRLHPQQDLLYESPMADARNIGGENVSVPKWTREQRARTNVCSAALGWISVMLGIQNTQEVEECAEVP